MFQKAVQLPEEVFQEKLLYEDLQEKSLESGLWEPSKNHNNYKGLNKTECGYKTRLPRKNA